MSRRMPRRETNFEFHAAQSQNLPLIEIDRGFGAGVDVKAEESATAPGTPQHMIVRMQRHQRQWIECIRNRAGAADMIEMGVRVPEMCDAPAACLCSSENDVSIPGRVNHGSIVCL